MTLFPDAAGCRRNLIIVPPSRIADWRAIAPQCLGDDVGSPSRPLRSLRERA
jgi:hypothetical protein